MSIWIREDGTITDECDPTAFEYVPADQRDQLRDALRPFAKYACDEPCDCHNCVARAVIEATEVVK